MAHKKDNSTDEHQEQQGYMHTRRKKVFFLVIAFGLAGLMWGMADNTPTTMPEEVKEQEVVYTTEKTALRRFPAAASDVLATLDENTTLKPVDVSTHRGWVEVNVRPHKGQDIQNGWVARGHTNIPAPKNGH